MRWICRPFSGAAWLGRQVMNKREARWRAQLARETAQVEEVAARIARADLTSDLKSFGRNPK